MQEPEIIFDEVRAEVRAEVAPDVFKDAYKQTHSDEQELLAHDTPELPQTQAAYEAIAKFNFVQRLTAKRTMRDNSRRTKILDGNEKIFSIVNRFNAHA